MTTQAQLQQANALRKANPNLSIQDSVTQAMNPIAPVANAPLVPAPVVQPVPTQPIQPASVAPVQNVTQPVAPVTQPVTTDNSDAARLARLEASGQGSGTAANNLRASISGTPPTQTTPTDTTKTTVTGPALATTTTSEKPGVNYNTSTGREANIHTNLDSITTSNPNLLTDRNSFNASFGYVSADAGKKAILDSYFLSKQATPDSLFQQLMQGVTIPKTAPGYQQAKTRFDNYSKYVSYTPTQFSTALTSGILLPGTQTYNDLVKNPYIKVQLDKANALNTINGKTVDINKATQTATNDIIDNSPLGQALKDGYISEEEAKALTTTPEISAKEDAIVTLKTDYDTQKAEYDNIRTSVEAELKGTGATRGQINALIGSRERDQKVGLDIATTTYNNALGQIADMKKSAADKFNINMTLYGQRQAEQSKIASEQRAMKNALITDQAQFDQKIAQQAQAMNNPTMAISSMIDEYKKLGIPFTRSTQQVIADFQSSGQDFPTYLSGLQKLIQEKPEYQQYLSQQAGKGVSYQTIGDSVYRQNADGSLTKTNISATKSQTPVWQVNPTTNTVPTSGTLISPTPEAIKSISTRLTGNNVQCGEVTNDYNAKVFPQATHITDSYESKVQAVQSIGVSQVPVVGGIFAMNTYNSTGHTGIVQSVDLANGTFIATEANAKGLTDGGPVQTSKPYKISDNFIFSNAPKGMTSPVDYKQYGLLSNTDYNINNPTDVNSKKYLDYYIQNGKAPTAAALGFSVRGAGGSKEFQDLQTRASDLYYQATGQAALPNQTDIKGTWKIINNNKILENKLGVQENTVMKNFQLAIDNIDKGGINQSSPVINNALNYIQNQWLGNPETAAYIAQNQTVANEIGSLLALKNAGGTTVSDKLEAANLIPKGASEEQQKLILKKIMQEADNASTVIAELNNQLYTQVDPLETQSSNPNRGKKLNIPASSPTSVTQYSSTPTDSNQSDWNASDVNDANNL